jgi:hypothetical protein
VTPAEAIEAAELAEAEIRYRNQVGRLMYEAGRREAEAEMAAQWSRITAATRGPWLHVLTLGLIPKPEPEPELEAGT